MSVDGLRHDACLFTSPEELLGVVVPFLDEAAASGIPVVVRLEEELEALVRQDLARPDRVDFVSGGALENPVRAAREMVDLAREHLDAGADQVRLVGGVPGSALASSVGWEQWARYEAGVNELFADQPMWALCCYPRLTAAVESDVAATHRGLVCDQEWGRSPAYVDPNRFIDDRNPVGGEDLDAHAPAFVLVDTHPNLARESVRRLAERAGFGVERAEDLVLGVNELFTNAVVHGLEPVVLRGWVRGGDVLFAVSDRGAGIDDRFAGVFPPEDDDRRIGGRGVWLARMCSDLVTFRRDVDGFTVRVAARAG